MRKWIVTVLLLVIGGASLANDLPSKGKVEGDSGSQQVCFSEKVTGSHLRKRICMTKEEREQRRQQDQEAMNKMQSSKAGGGARKTAAER